MKRLELKNKFSCKTITKSTGPSFYRNGRAACPHRSLIAVVRNNSLTRQKKNWEKLLCGCFIKDFRSKHICFSLTSSKAYAENFSDIFHKRSCLTRQKKNWEKLLCGCFIKDFRSKHICFSLTSSKAYAENFSDIFHKRSTWMPYSRKNYIKERAKCKYK